MTAPRLVLLQADGSLVVAPLQPNEDQWGGLARDMMMWLDMNGPGEKTPRALFKHLKRLGREVPQWLRDEPEMQSMDHVPSKGTRCAIIYKAMLAARPPVEGVEVTEEMIRRAICDPGAVVGVRHADRETVSEWQTRAILALLSSKQKEVG